MSYQVVEVEWIDSHTDNDWASIRDVKRDADDRHALRMHTCGFLVVSEADYIVVSGTYSAAIAGEENLVNCTMQIPRACITEQRFLTERGGTEGD